MKSVSSGDQERGPPARPPRVCPKCGERFLDDALFCPNDGSPLASPQRVSADQVDPYVGMEISGHIKIGSLAGVGAMGRVYKAFQAGVERDVAVKILHRELSANQQLVQRFHREAKVASRLSHPNVVHVHLAGQLQDGAMYIVMEFLDGLSLQSALAASGGAMDLPRALHVTLQICDAVGEAHAQGVVHRDLKPENVMLVRRGGDPDFVKVLDFGIARLNWGEQSMTTAAGLIFGTARYISPEGAQGEVVGPAGDVYSIATLLYQMLAGRTPFEGDQAVALLVSQIHDPAPPLRSIPRAFYVPEPIAQLVTRNLSKDQRQRDPDARAFARSLLEAAKAAGLAADELAMRPLLSRPPRAMQLPPIARTRQLQLDSETQERLALASPSSPPLDETLDDVEPPKPAHAVGSKTEMSAPVPAALVSSSAPRARTSEPTSEDVERAGLPPRRFGARAFAIFFMCFALGVIGATAIAYKLGFVGSGAHAQERDLELAKAALAARKWDSPPGDNVLEITDRALARSPNDAQILDVRHDACDEITKLAVTEWTKGNKSEGLRLIRLARRFHPEDAAVTLLASTYEAESDGGAAPLLNSGKDAGLKLPPLLRTNNTPAPSGSAPTGPRLSVDVTPAAPRVGAPATLQAKVQVGAGPPKSPPTEALFEIDGPTLQGIRLPTTCDATGACSAQFTFLEAGKFTVSFSAKADGQAIKNQRVVVVGGPTPAPSDSANPLPSATGKWM